MYFAPLSDTAKVTGARSIGQILLESEGGWIMDSLFVSSNSCIRRRSLVFLGRGMLHRGEAWPVPGCCFSDRLSFRATPVAPATAGTELVPSHELLRKANWRLSRVPRRRMARSFPPDASRISSPYENGGRNDDTT